MLKVICSIFYFPTLPLKITTKWWIFYKPWALKEYSNETLNIFWKNHMWKFGNSWNEITEKYIFFFFQPSVFFIFVKIWTPVLTFHFRLIKLWCNNEHVLRIIRSCCVKCMIVFQELNFDPVKEMLKIRCHIYILIKKVIISRKK